MISKVWRLPDEWGQCVGTWDVVSLITEIKGVQEPGTSLQKQY